MFIQFISRGDKIRQRLVLR